MENQKRTSFTLEIDNFSDTEAPISSPIFQSGGCDWFLNVHPKGMQIEGYLSVFLNVANPESLQPGWKRTAIFSFILLNQSGTELCRTYEVSKLFFTETPAWGYHKMFPLTKLQEEGFMEKNKLIIKTEVEVVEVVHEQEVTGEEMFDFSGFQIRYTQAKLVNQILVEHPDFAVNFKPTIQEVRTAYMNVLLGLIETLDKPPRELSEAELSNAQRNLSELIEAGFKLDWLKTKLEEVSFERMKVFSNGARVQELEEHVKTLKLELDNEKAESSAIVFSLEQMVSELKHELEKERSTKFLNP